MNREYQKWHSPALGKNMELLVFGHAGVPLLVFPTAMGRFFEYEDRGMIDALRHKYERGGRQAFCVDSMDSESWYDRNAHPRTRVLRQNQYERYLLDEVIPFIRNRNWGPLGVTGCGFGGYHAVNFSFRHPELVSDCISMGGSFNIRNLLDDYYDEDCYFHNPVDYLSNISDSWYLDHFRRVQTTLATGECDPSLGENQRLSDVLHAKGIPHTLDVWADGTGGDWPWWQSMARKYL